MAAANNEVRIKIIYQEVGKGKIKASEKRLKALGAEVSRLEKNFKSSLGKTTTAITKQSKATKQLGTESTKQFKKMGIGVTMLAWHFRYLGNIFDRIAKQMIKSIKDVVMVASELEESFLSIRTAATVYGRDAEKATKLSQDLALKGLLPLIDSANAVQRLMIGGLGVPEAEQFIYRFLDVAFLWTNTADGMTKALEAVTDAVLRGKEKIGMNTTALNLWTQAEERVERTLGISFAALTKRSKLLAILQVIEEEYAYTLGFHRMEMETVRATMVRLNAAITLIKQAFGVALVPLVESAAKIMAVLATRIQKLLDILGPAIPVIVAVGVAVAFFVSKISFAIGILLSLSKVAGFAAIAMWKIYLPVIAVSAVVMAATYLFLKYTGALDKTKNAAISIDAQLKKLENTYKGLMDITADSIDIDEEKAVAHRRKVEDIEEDLARERSKGLWANQMTIKDLEKRLKREDEDWNRYLKSKGTASDTSNKGLLGSLADTFSAMEDETKKHVDNIISLWNKLKDPEMWAGIRMAIQEFIGGAITDPAFWKEFWKNFTDNLSKTIIGAGDIITAIFEGLFGSVMRGVAVIAASAFVLSFGTSILKLLPFKAAEIGIATGLAFNAAILPFLTITITLLTGLAISQAWDLRKTIQGLWDSAETGNEVANKAISFYIQQLKDGKIDAEEFKRVTDDVIANQQKGLELAEKGGFWGGRSIWEVVFPSLHLPTFQTGGIVPGRKNEPVPILAHGGERVIPAGETTNMGGVSININNPIVRSEQDIKDIASQVSKIMGQRQRWGALGAF